MPGSKVLENDALRILILTSKESGIAGSVVETLQNSPAVAECAALLAGMSAARKDMAWLRRKAKKIWLIGPLGAANGLRIRKWFNYGTVLHLPTVCDRLNVSLLRAPEVNSDEALVQIRDWAPDLMISMGNPILKERIFAQPPWGTINYHGELLPEYAGAQSIIWPIHFERRVSGFTIHKVARRLDAGDILYRCEVPITFRPTLRGTIEATGTCIQGMVPGAFRELVENWPAHWDDAYLNPVAESFTTPTVGQFLRMVRNNRRLYAMQRREAPA